MRTAPHLRTRQATGLVGAAIAAHALASCQPALLAPRGLVTARQHMGLQRRWHRGMHAARHRGVIGHGSGRHRAALARLHGHEPVCALGLRSLLHAPVAGVTAGRCLLPVQQRAGLRDGKAALTQAANLPSSLRARIAVSPDESAFPLCREAGHLGRARRAFSAWVAAGRVARRVGRPLPPRRPMPATPVCRARACQRRCA